MIQKWSQNDTKIILKWSQNDPKMILKWSQNDSKILPTLFQKRRNYVVLFSKALVIERKKLSPEARKKTRAFESLKITSKKHFYVPIIYVYDRPGDRAQKVIPGGAKTNESFWKSQNDVKKSILRFPSFVFTKALVIERKKISYWNINISIRY